MRPLVRIISQVAVPIAAPESLGNGAIQMSSNRSLARSMLFHLMFGAQPPPITKLGRRGELWRLDRVERLGPGNPLRSAAESRRSRRSPRYAWNVAMRSAFESPGNNSSRLAAAFFPKYAALSGDTVGKPAMISSKTGKADSSTWPSAA
ncbi:hypothetical protein MOV08_06795 [Streptomyces yunnanensis]|uniref:Uncharacterized protein n=1 Tax=Streptomyces yunnanensis TaxID=156453 RepID=A0ABY8A253_9ACTN|nr:hypothetical protein [Streptomyces yunnanensis]WEB39040.1 hypothetical protein MOV08_06795 [Streptomyces yunnanensis]